MATNAGNAGEGYYAMSNGAWTVFTPGSGTGGGADQSPWTNNVDGAGYSLTNAGAVVVTGRVTGAQLWLGTASYFYDDGTNVLLVRP
jgi:hypothetical protein